MFVKHKSRPAAKALDIFPSGWYILSVFGEMSERFKEPVLKTGDGATHRGFESHSLRQQKSAPIRGRFFVNEEAGFERATQAQPGEKLSGGHYPL